MRRKILECFKARFQSYTAEDTYRQVVFVSRIFSNVTEYRSHLNLARIESLLIYIEIGSVVSNLLSKAMESAFSNDEWCWYTYKY